MEAEHRRGYAISLPLPPVAVMAPTTNAGSVGHQDPRSLEEGGDVCCRPSLPRSPRITLLQKVSRKSYHGLNTSSFEEQTFHVDTCM